MAKKEYKSVAAFVYFNSRHLKTKSDDMLEAIELEAARFLMPYGNVSDLKWITLKNLEDLVSRNWESNYANAGVPDYFRRYWLDKLVSEWKINIWNVVWNNARKITDDKTADRLATEAETAFSKVFY